MFYEKVYKSSKIPPDLLKKYIWENVEKRVKDDSVELVIPWHFGRAPHESSDPLTLRVSPERPPSCGAEVQKMRAKGYAVDNGYYPYYVISDGGRCLAELQKRLGETDTYIPRIKRILYDCGMLELKSGHVITGGYYALDRFSHTNALNAVLTAVSIISNFDVLLEVDGEIRKGGDRL
jgi:hypothetical protein